MLQHQVPERQKGSEVRKMEKSEQRERSLVMQKEITDIKIQEHKSWMLFPYIATQAHTHCSLCLPCHAVIYLSCVLQNLFSLSVSRLFFPWQRSRGRAERLKKASEKEKDKEILTGICYSHRHHAASEREGALLV